MNFNPDSKINIVNSNDMDVYGSTVTLEQLKKELDNIHENKVFRIKERESSTWLTNDDILYPILALIFIIGSFTMAFYFGFALFCLATIPIILIYRKRKSKQIVSIVETKKSMFYKYIDVIEKESKNNIQKILRENKINLNNIKNVELLNTNIRNYERGILQIGISKDKIIILELPIYEIKIIYNKYAYHILVWNSKEKALINSFNENEIQNYTYFGETITKTNVNGGGMSPSWWNVIWWCWCYNREQRRYKSR